MGATPCDNGDLAAGLEAARRLAVTMEVPIGSWPTSPRVPKMPRFTRETALPVPAAEAFAWHARPGAFERLTPPWEHIDVVAREGTIHDGDRLVMKVHRVVDIDLPDIAKKVLKPTAVCIQTDEWWPAGDGHDGTFRVETKGQPVEITGKTKVRPGEGGTTDFEVSVEVKVKVPVIGGKIAGIMRGDAEKLMEDEFAWNDERLATSTGA